MLTIDDCIRSISVNGKLDTTPRYSVTQAAKFCGLSAYTLRYYDRMGLFPFLQRNPGAKRLFSEADMQWVQLIECLRSTGMSIQGIKGYVQLCLQGDSTLKDRLEIVTRQERIMKKQLQDMENHLKLMQFKKYYYENLLKNDK